MTNQGKPKYSKTWRKQVLELIEMLSLYFWYMTERGCIFNDPDPTEEEVDSLRYVYEDPIVFAANLDRDAEGLPPFSNNQWEEAGTYIGFNAEEVYVLFTTYSLDREHYEVDVKAALGKAFLEKYWSPWLREKLEASLLQD